MRHLWSQFETWFFGSELVYKYQNGTIVPDEVVSEWGIYN